MKVLDLAVEQPTSCEVNKVYKDVTQDQTLPLRLGFIPSLSDLMKETWTKPSFSYQIPRRMENHYKTYGDNMDFMLKHSLPNSFVADATQKEVIHKEVIWRQFPITRGAGN